MNQDRSSLLLVQLPPLLLPLRESLLSPFASPHVSGYPSP